MRKNILLLPVCMLCLQNLHAQNYTAVKHTNGSVLVAGNEVTVTQQGRASSTNFDGTGPYHIGNARRANSYDFTFAKPVGKLRLDIAAINEGEQIEIAVNDRRYPINSGDLIANNAENAIASDGNITAAPGTTAHTQVDIVPGYPVHKISVRHLNGQASGSVFSLLLPDTDKATPDKTTGIDNTAATETPAIFPNPTTGSFTVTSNLQGTGDANIEIANQAGQVVYSQKASATGNTIQEDIKLDERVAAGLYTLRVSQEGVVHSVKLTIVK